MSLSFREEAAIRFLNANDTSPTDAISLAQGLADLFCARNGHNPDKDARYYATTCSRCGVKTQAPRV